jgi:hypothetical protein
MKLTKKQIIEIVEINTYKASAMTEELLDGVIYGKWLDVHNFIDQYKSIKRKTKAQVKVALMENLKDFWNVGFIGDVIDVEQISKILSNKKMQIHYIDTQKIQDRKLKVLKKYQKQIATEDGEIQTGALGIPNVSVWQLVKDLIKGIFRK